MTRPLMLRAARHFDAPPPLGFRATIPAHRFELRLLGQAKALRLCWTPHPRLAFQGGVFFANA